MFRRKKYMYDNLRKVGLPDAIINDLYLEGISKENVDTIVHSKYPYAMSRLMVTKEFREMPDKELKGNIVQVIDSCKEGYQAECASTVAINSDVMECDYMFEIVSSVSLAVGVKEAVTATKLATDKHILAGDCPVALVSMASVGYDLASINRANSKRKARMKVKNPVVGNNKKY